MKHKMYFLAFLGLGICNIAQAEEFSDVFTDHPNYEAITSLAEKGIVQGYDDMTFKPDQAINRAEFLKIIVESVFSGNETQNCTNNNLLPNWKYAYLSDVDRDAWYANYVCQGKLNGFIGGYTDGTFRPGNTINYVEALKIVFGANDDLGVLDAIGQEWYSPYLESVNAYGIGLEVDPSKELTRGEMAQLVYNYMNLNKTGKYEEEGGYLLDNVDTSDWTDEDYENFYNEYVSSLSENDQAIMQSAEDSKSISFEEAGFAFDVPEAWQDYELRTYDWQDDLCGYVNVKIYYLYPAGEDYSFDLSKNELPITITRYQKDEYCSDSYAWQQEAITKYNSGDKTVSDEMNYLGAVYSESRTLQNDEYLYQIYPWQVGEPTDNFVYTADMYEIELAISSFSISSIEE